MGQPAYSDTVWRAGQPLDPTSKVMSGQELTDRLLYLEKAFTGMQLGDLPVSELQRALEQSWVPDPATLFASGSVTREALSVAWAGGKVGSTGTKVSAVAGSPDWTVVRNGAGDYTVTFPAYKAIPLVFATSYTSGSAFSRVSAATVSTARFLFGGDADFDWMVWGK
jgi:hypothetical protein